MNRKALHLQAFGLYAVIVGLAIREGVTDVVPLLTATADALAKHNIEAWQTLLFAYRLAIFLLVILRFFLGAAFYFNEVYFSEEAATEYKRKSFGLDYVIGLVHFLFFFGWATTITDLDRVHLGGGSQYFGVALMILFYDAVWFLVSFRFDTRQEIKCWAAINFVTAGFAGLIFLALQGLGVDAVAREAIALGMIALVSVLDAGEIIYEKPYLTNLLRAFFFKGGDKVPRPAQDKISGVA